MEKKTFSMEVGGKTLTATFTNLADQAHGSVILAYGKTTVLATAVMSDRKKEGLDYFPLSVDYEEKFYAAGQILGSRYQRREGRPNDEAVLSGRVVDRTIRPLFDQRIRNEVQVIVTVLSIDEDDPDVLAVNAASLAIATSDIPWGGPVAAIRIGKTQDGQRKVNPTYKERRDDTLEYDVLVCGRDGTINMIETEAKQSSEDEIASAFETGLTELKKLEDFQKQIVSEIGKEKRDVAVEDIPDDIKNLFEEKIGSKLESAALPGTPGKGAIGALKDEWFELLTENLPEASKSHADDLFEHEVDLAIHKAAVLEGKRADGRGMKEVRPLYAEAGNVAPMLHGSGTFFRGGTHVFSALTLGSPEDSQIIDSIESQDASKRFMHHYNFPPFSVGETGRVGGFNRRMIGHGALAEKALRAVVPTKEQFPYTIRVVSECMASNGSTSMGSICASTIAMMDGGVPISAPVAGIAMGLMIEDDKHVVLTDIQGPEDHFGDMDCKIAGTRDGVTAMQMDVKVSGIKLEILKEALEDAKQARLTILDVIESEIPEPRAELRDHAPHILTLTINPDDIGKVIGSGGKTINGIKDTTGVESIQIEDDGSIFITGNKESAAAAYETISNMTKKFEKGENLTGEVVRITDFGAFVKLNEFTDGLVHISEIAPFRIEKVTDILSVGDQVPVTIKDIDDQDRVKLSIKDVDPDYAKKHGGQPSTSGQQPKEGSK